MFTATKDDIRGMKSSTPNLQDNSGETKGDLREAANNAGRKARNFVHNASDEIVHATETVTTRVRANPMQSSLIALGVGFVLGALFRR